MEFAKRQMEKYGWSEGTVTGYYSCSLKLSKFALWILGYVYTPKVCLCW